MVASRKDENIAGKGRPATTTQQQENHMISLAMDIVEKKMLSGLSTSQENIHFLKLGSETARLERVKLEKEILLKDAQVENLASAGRIEELYGKAMDAFKGYQPSQDDDIA